MNIEGKKNKELILKFIELNDLITGRNKLKENVNVLRSDLEEIESKAIRISYNINKINKELSVGKNLIKNKPDKIQKMINYFKTYDSLEKVIDEMPCSLCPNEIYYSNSWERWIKVFGRMNEEFGIYAEIWKESSLEDEFIELEFENNIKKFNEEYLELREKIRHGINEIRDAIRNDFLKDINIHIEDIRIKVLLLSKIIYQKENQGVFEEYERLRKKILLYLDNYDCKNIKKEKIMYKEEELLKEKEVLFKLSETFITKEDKEIALSNPHDFMIQLKNNKEEQISLANQMIDNVTKGIEAAFNYLIPSKYIFDYRFREYAVECLFYERCNSVGEVLNYYENLELHDVININFELALGKLDNLQSLQFHQIMQLENVSKGIDEVNRGITSINENLDSVNNNLDSINNNLDFINNNLIDMNVAVEYGIQDVIYENERRQKELMTEMSYNNKLIKEEIQSANNLAYQQIDALSNINSESRKIAKDIYNVKEFTERYRNAKVLEGKSYY